MIHTVNESNVALSKVAFCMHNVYLIEFLLFVLMPITLPLWMRLKQQPATFVTCQQSH